MTGPHSNQFALFSRETSDSDDSGYVEDHSKEFQGENVDQTKSARTPSEQVDQEAWQVVSRREPAETTSRGVRYRLDRTLDWYTQQTVGMIVRHVDFHHFPTSNAPRNQGGDVVNLPGGGEILKKNRLFLIVGRASGRLTECPIFTYGGKGLRGRKKVTWPEYCSIRPSHVPVKDFENQSPRNKVLDVEWVYWNEEVKESSVVRLSDVRSHDTGFSLPPAQVVGAVSSEALRYAAKKVVDLMREATTNARL